MRKLKVPLGPSSSFHLFLLGDVWIVETKALYLPSNIGTITFIEIEHSSQLSITRVLHIGINKAIRQVFPFVIVKVHRQETDVCSNISVSKPLIEFNAVNDRERLPPEDMFEAEVSMAVSNPV